PITLDNPSYVNQKGDLAFCADALVACSSWLSRADRLRLPGVLPALPPRPHARQIALHDVPDQREIHAEVLVDQLVAHPGDQSPRHLRLQGAGGFGDSLDGLADDLDVADHSILGLTVEEEGFPPVDRVAQDGVDRLDRMQ